MIVVVSLQQGEGTGREWIKEGKEEFVWSGEVKVKSISRVFKEEVWVSELLADGTAEENTLLWDTGELQNFSTLLFKLYNHVTDLYRPVFLCFHFAFTLLALGAKSSFHLSLSPHLTS